MKKSIILSNCRIAMGYNLSLAAEIPLGFVLVKDINEQRINDNECLTVSLWILGLNGTCKYCACTASVMLVNVDRKLEQITTGRHSI